MLKSRDPIVHNPTGLGNRCTSRCFSNRDRVDPDRSLACHFDEFARLVVRFQIYPFVDAGGMVREIADRDGFPACERADQGGLDDCPAVFVGPVSNRSDMKPVTHAVFVRTTDYQVIKILIHSQRYLAADRSRVL